MTLAIGFAMSMGIVIGIALATVQYPRAATIFLRNVPNSVRNS